MKKQIKYLFSTVIIVIIFFILNCTFIPPDDGWETVTYSLEYDNQTGCDLLSISDFLIKINNAYDRGADGAKTFVEFNVDQSDNSLAANPPLPVVNEYWNRLGIYCSECLTTEVVNGVRVAVYPAHLVVIKDIADLNMGSKTGKSCMGGPNGWSVVIWDHCNSDDHKTKVAIHELGHQRAELTHLCTDPTNHDRDDCVMAQGITATCYPYKNVVNNPRFCNICEEKIRNISW